MAGVSNSLTPTAAASVEKVEFGEESLMELEVTHAAWDPLETVAQPAGKAGAATASKFSENEVENLPSCKGNETVPKS